MDFIFLIHAIVVAVTLVVGVSSTLIFKMKKNNPIELIAEEIIKEETGISLDLDPQEK